ERKGNIINMASNAGIGTAAKNTTFYAITKASIIMFTKRLAFDLKDTGVHVNAIAPGWIETDFTIGGKQLEEIKKLEDDFKSRTTLEMFGKPDYIGNIALFLASADSIYVNGQVIVADGGRIDNLTHGI
ncbi:MAG: SDR family oxidoreductase, partial [Thermoplasmata archaeon]